MAKVVEFSASNGQFMKRPFVRNGANGVEIREEWCFVIQERNGDIYMFPFPDSFRDEYVRQLTGIVVAAASPVLPANAKI